MPAAAEEILDDAVDRREALEVREPHLAGVPTIRNITDPRWPFPLCIPANISLSRVLVHGSELARNGPDSQVHHLPRAYDDGLPSSAIRLRM